MTDPVRHAAAERAIERVCAQADISAWISVLDVEHDGEFDFDANYVVSSASVFKVAVALEVARQIASHELDRSAVVVLPAARRTPGPTGFSRFADDATASVRDLASAMLAISDNAATDALIGLVSLKRVHATLTGLGLIQTVIPYPLGEMLSQLAAAAGFATWSDLVHWSAQPHPDDATEDVDRRVVASAPMQPATGIRTTPREAARLLRLIWRDEAGPPAACALVREWLSHQLAPRRLATGFAPGTRIAAKSGSLVGVVRNEVGVISRPDGHSFAVAVFTRTEVPLTDDGTIDRAIGAVARIAVDALG